jgi:hypothetical protein
MVSICRSGDRAEHSTVHATISDRHDDLTAHNLSLQMGVAVVLAGAVVAIAADGLVGGQL